MSGWFERYQQGFYQEVYDELLAMQERVWESPVYEEALLVMRTIMRRARYNIELLISRLREMGYLFGEGFAESPEEKAYWEREAPVYRPPTSDTLQNVALLEQRVGPLPLALKCWFFRWSHCPWMMECGSKNQCCLSLLISFLNISTVDQVRITSSCHAKP